MVSFSGRLVSGGFGCSPAMLPVPANPVPENIVSDVLFLSDHTTSHLTRTVSLVRNVAARMGTILVSTEFTHGPRKEKMVVSYFADLLPLLFANGVAVAENDNVVPLTVANSVEGLLFSLIWLEIVPPSSYRRVMEADTDSIAQKEIEDLVRSTAFWNIINFASSLRLNERFHPLFTNMDVFVDAERTTHEIRNLRIEYWEEVRNYALSTWKLVSTAVEPQPGNGINKCAIYSVTDSLLDDVETFERMELEKREWFPVSGQFMSVPGSCFGSTSQLEEKEVGNKQISVQSAPKGDNLMKSTEKEETLEIAMEKRAVGDFVFKESALSSSAPQRPLTSSTFGSQMTPIPNLAKGPETPSVSKIFPVRKFIFNEISGKVVAVAGATKNAVAPSAAHRGKSSCKLSTTSGKAAHNHKSVLSAAGSVTLLDLDQSGRKTSVGTEPPVSSPERHSKDVPSGAAQSALSDGTKGGPAPNLPHTVSIGSSSVVAAAFPTISESILSSSSKAAPPPSFPHTISITRRPLVAPTTSKSISSSGASSAVDLSTLADVPTADSVVALPTEVMTTGTQRQHDTQRPGSSTPPSDVIKRSLDMSSDRPMISAPKPSDRTSTPAQKRSTPATVKLASTTSTLAKCGQKRQAPADRPIVLPPPKRRPNTLFGVTLTSNQVPYVELKQIPNNWDRKIKEGSDTYQLLREFLNKVLAGTGNSLVVTNRLDRCQDKSVGEIYLRLTLTRLAMWPGLYIRIKGSGCQLESAVLLAFLTLLMDVTGMSFLSPNVMAVLHNQKLKAMVLNAMIFVLVSGLNIGSTSARSFDHVVYQYWQDANGPFRSKLAKLLASKQYYWPQKKIVLRGMTGEDISRLQKVCAIKNGVMGRVGLFEYTSPPFISANFIRKISAGPSDWQEGDDSDVEVVEPPPKPVPELIDLTGEEDSPVVIGCAATSPSTRTDDVVPNTKPTVTLSEPETSITNSSPPITTEQQARAPIPIPVQPPSPQRNIEVAINKEDSSVETALPEPVGVATSLSADRQNGDSRTAVEPAAETGNMRPEPLTFGISLSPDEVASVEMRTIPDNWDHTLAEGYDVYKRLLNFVNVCLEQTRNTLVVTNHIAGFKDMVDGDCYLRLTLSRLVKWPGLLFDVKGGGCQLESAILLAFVQFLMDVLGMSFLSPFAVTLLSNESCSNLILKTVCRLLELCSAHPQQGSSQEADMSWFDVIVSRHWKSDNDLFRSSLRTALYSAGMTRRRALFGLSRTEHRILHSICGTRETSVGRRDMFMHTSAAIISAESFIKRTALYSAGMTRRRALFGLSRTEHRILHSICGTRETSVGRRDMFMHTSAAIISAESFIKLHNSLRKVCRVTVGVSVGSSQEADMSWFDVIVSRHWKSDNDLFRSSLRTALYSAGMTRRRALFGLSRTEHRILHSICGTRETSVGRRDMFMHTSAAIISAESFIKASVGSEELRDGDQNHMEVVEAPTEPIHEVIGVAEESAEANPPELISFPKNTPPATPPPPSQNVRTATAEAVSAAPNAHEKPQPAVNRDIEAVLMAPTENVNAHPAVSNLVGTLPAASNVDVIMQPAVNNAAEAVPSMQKKEVGEQPSVNNIDTVPTESNSVTTAIDGVIAQPAVINPVVHSIPNEEVDAKPSVNSIGTVPAASNSVTNASKDDVNTQPAVTDIESAVAGTMPATSNVNKVDMNTPPAVNNDVEVVPNIPNEEVDVKTAVTNVDTVNSETAASEINVTVAQPAVNSVLEAALITPKEEVDAQPVVNSIGTLPAAPSIIEPPEGAARSSRKRLSSPDETLVDSPATKQLRFSTSLPFGLSTPFDAKKSSWHHLYQLPFTEEQQEIMLTGNNKSMPAAVMRKQFMNRLLAKTKLNLVLEQYTDPSSFHCGFVIRFEIIPHSLFRVKYRVDTSSSCEQVEDEMLAAMLTALSGGVPALLPPDAASAVLLNQKSADHLVTYVAGALKSVVARLKSLRGFIAAGVSLTPSQMKENLNSCLTEYWGNNQRALETRLKEVRNDFGSVPLPSTRGTQQQTLGSSEQAREASSTFPKIKSPSSFYVNPGVSQRTPKTQTTRDPPHKLFESARNSLLTPSPEKDGPAGSGKVSRIPSQDPGREPVGATPSRQPKRVSIWDSGRLTVRIENE